MNRTIKSCILIASIAALVSCRKKNETPQQTQNTAATTGTNPPHVNTYSAVVNGQNWTMAYNATYGLHATFISKFGSQYSFGAQSDFNTPYTMLSLSFPYSTGIHQLAKFNTHSAQYRDSANVLYPVKSGTVEIISLDTVPANQGIIGKAKMKFSFITDTVSGKSFTVSNGLIDFIKK